MPRRNRVFSIVDTLTSVSSDPPPSYNVEPDDAPTPVNSRRERYSAWPWYLPPPGWIVHPSWDISAHPPDWTAFVPNTSKALKRNPYPAYMTSTPLTPRSPVAQNPWFPQNSHLSLASAPHQGTGHPHPSSVIPSPRTYSPTFIPSPPPGVDPMDVPGPSPFFARIPPSGPNDARFGAYRKAQAESPGSTRHPLMHPAFGPPLTQDTPEFWWDLTVQPQFDVIAASAHVRLLPEESATYLTHPPQRTMRIRLLRFPALSFELSVPAPAGLIVFDLLRATFDFVTRHFTTDEYTALDKVARERVRTAHVRRTGVAHGYAEPGETPYLVLDALGSRRFFLALAPAGEKGVWLLATTRRPRGARIA